MPPATEDETNTDSRRTAVDDVFDVPELLEMILTHLPMKELLLDTSVSKQWKATIAGSHKLQKTLFMVPEPIKSQYQFDPDELRMQETPASTFPSSGSMEDLPEDFSNPFVVVVANPLPVEFGNLDPYAVGTTLLDETEDYVWMLDLDVSATYYGFSPSWRRMYATQPPAQTLRAAIPLDLNPDSNVDDIEIHNPQGITMGEVVDAIFRRVKRDKRRSEKNCKRSDTTSRPRVMVLEDMMLEMEGMKVLGGEKDIDTFAKFVRFTNSRIGDFSDVEELKAAWAEAVLDEE